MMLQVEMCVINKLQVFSPENNVCSKCLHGITSAKVAGQIMDNALRIADSSSCHPSDPGKDLLAIAQSTSDRKCKSSVMENALSENSKGAAIGNAESCPSHFLEINLGKKHRHNGYTNQEFREKDMFNHSNSSAFSRTISSAAVSPSLRKTHEKPVYDKNLQPSGVLSSHGHNTCESTMQAQVPLDSSTEGVAILCSSSVREDAGTSCSSPRKDSLSQPSYGFILVPIPVGAGIPFHYGAIMQPDILPACSFYAM